MEARATLALLIESFMSFVNIAHAQGGAATAVGFLNALNQAVIFPLITLLMAAALLVFLWGVFEYIRDATNDQSRTQGRSHMIWGIVGMLVMLSALGILTIAAATFGIEGELNNAQSGSFGTGAGNTNFGTGAGNTNFGTP